MWHTNKFIGRYSQLECTSHSTPINLPFRKRTLYGPVLRFHPSFICLKSSTLMLTVQESGICSRPSGEATSLPLRANFSLFFGRRWEASVWNEIHSRLWVFPMNAGHLGTFLLIPRRYICFMVCFFKSTLHIHWAEIQSETGNGQAREGIENDEETGSL